MRKFLMNTSLSLLGKVIGMIALMILDIYLAKRLNVDKYAEWVFFFSIVTILFFICGLGLNPSSKVIISKERNNENIRGNLQAAFFLRLIASVVSSSCAAVIMVVASEKLGYPHKYPDLRLLFVISGVLIFFNTFTEFYKEIFMGLEWFKALFGLTVIEYVGYLLYVIIFLKGFSSVYYVAYAYAASGLTVFFLGIAILNTKYNLCRNFFPISDNFKYYIKKIVPYAVPMLFLGIGTVILIEIDTFMLGILSSKAEVAVYNIAKGITSKAAHINYSIAVGAMTSFSVIYGGEIEAKRINFRKVAFFNFVITSIVALMLLVIAPQIINLLYGERYMDAGITVKMLMPYYFLYSLLTFYSTFLDFRGKARSRSIAFATIIIIDIILNCIFISTLGATGAALATCISITPYTIFTMAMSNIEWKRISLTGGDRNERKMEK